MPELPEVETVRRDLARELQGAVIDDVTVTGARSVRRNDARTFRRALRGRTFTSFGRHGKYLLIGLDESGPNDSGLDERGPNDRGPDARRPVGRGPDDRRVLVAHLRMSGQFLLVPSGTPLVKHTHVRLALADGRELRFVDPRTFGELFVTTADLPELATLGVDALVLDRPRLRALLGARRGRLKALMLDQRVIAGIGNIYSDEILWTARLRGSRQANRLRPVEVGRLHDAIAGILGEAVERRGSSLSDAQYVDLAGQPGSYQEAHNVYGREGLPCPRCGRVIERTVVAQRSHFWCRNCQR